MKALFAVIGLFDPRAAEPFKVRVKPTGVPGVPPY